MTAKEDKANHEQEITKNTTGEHDSLNNAAVAEAVVEEKASASASNEQNLSDLDQHKAAWEKEREELLGQLMRKQADFDNFRRISRADQGESREYGLFKFLEKLLPVLDNLERALQSARKETVSDSYVEGLDMIYRQMLQLLEQEGVTAMVPTGQPFDPHYHHAVMQVEEGEPGCVAEELQKGYLYKKRVLRPALVKVCQG